MSSICRMWNYDPSACMYSVVGNANVLKGGGQLGNPPIRVWADQYGRVWSLDHRRLAAYQLGGSSKIDLRWVQPKTVYNEAWKMTTETGGKGIGVRMQDSCILLIR